MGVRRASKESLSWAKDKLVSFHIPMSSLGWFYARVLCSQSPNTKLLTLCLGLESDLNVLLQGKWLLP